MVLCLDPIDAVDGEVEGGKPPGTSSEKASVCIHVDIAEPASAKSMVSIRNCEATDSDTTPTIFPPIDHENLFDSPPDSRRISPEITDDRNLAFNDTVTDSDSDSSTLSTFSPSVSSSELISPLSSAAAVIPATGAGWCFSWSELFRSKVMRLLRLLAIGFSSSRGIFVTYRSATLTGLLIALLYFRRRRRLAATERSLDTLAGIRRKRDEKMDHLMDQVFRLNQTLLALHRIPKSSPP